MYPGDAAGVSCHSRGGISLPRDGPSPRWGRTLQEKVQGQNLKRVAAKVATDRGRPETDTSQRTMDAHRNTARCVQPFVACACRCCRKPPRDAAQRRGVSTGLCGGRGCHELPQNRTPAINRRVACMRAHRVLSRRRQRRRRATARRRASLRCVGSRRRGGRDKATRRSARVAGRSTAGRRGGRSEAHHVS